MKKIVFSTNSVRLFFKEFSHRDVEIISYNDAKDNGLPNRGIFDVGLSNIFAIIIDSKAKAADIIDALSLADDGDGTLIVVTEYNQSFARIEKEAQVVKRHAPKDARKFTPWVSKWCDKVGLAHDDEFTSKAIEWTDDIDLALSAVISAGELEVFDDRLIPFVVKKSDIWDISNSVFDGDSGRALSKFIDFSGKSNSAHPVVIPLSSYFLKVAAVGDTNSDTDDIVKNTYYFNKNFSAIGRKNIKNFLLSEMNMISRVDSPLLAGSYLADMTNRKSK